MSGDYYLGVRTDQQVVSTRWDVIVSECCTSETEVVLEVIPHRLVSSQWVSTFVRD